MSAALEKPKLFPENKQFVLFGFVLVCVIVVRLFIEYLAYEALISKPFYYTHADVMDAYIKTKEDKRYCVLKLKSDDGYVFYTTRHTGGNLFNIPVYVYKYFPIKAYDISIILVHFM